MDEFRDRKIFESKEDKWIRRLTALVVLILSLLVFGVLYAIGPHGFHWVG